MKLLINQIPVEITLETEKTLGDLRLSLSKWAQENSQHLLGILVDGKAYDASMAMKSLDSVGLFELETVSTSDQVLASLTVVADFFDLAVTACRQKNNALLSDLQNEFSAVKATLASFGMDSAGLDTPWEATLLAPKLERLQVAIGEALNELTQPQKAFGMALITLGQQLAGVSELAGLWQKGQDQAALGWIRALMVTLETLNRIASRSLSGTAQEKIWKDSQDSLSPFLGEVEAALGSGDFVLVNDLFEYEIAPRLEEVRRKMSGDFVLDRVATPPLE